MTVLSMSNEIAKKRSGDTNSFFIDKTSGDRQYLYIFSSCTVNKCLNSINEFKATEFFQYT